MLIVEYAMESGHPVTADQWVDAVSEVPDVMPWVRVEVQEDKPA